MITKTREHEINRDGKRLLREALEPLGWVVNDVEEDYGIDSNIQIFDQKSPTGAWFHVQLKSSASSNYSTDGSFISQPLSIDHARHFALEMHQPVFLVHANVLSKRIFWYAPQLDRWLIAVLNSTRAEGVTVRILTRQELPGSATVLLATLETTYLALSNRRLTSASNDSFAESIKHLPDQQKFYRAFQEKSDTLRLKKIGELLQQRKLKEARPRAEAVLADPDSAVEIKFWARVQLEGIESTEAVHGGKPQSELPKIAIANAKALQTLTSSGPNYLKFYALIARSAAELYQLVHENLGLYMAFRQHHENGGQPMMSLGLYARRSAFTKRIVYKYNQCLRLVRYSTNYSDRWMLGRALTKVVNAIAPYLITLNSEKNLEAELAIGHSALQICKVAVRICEETGDSPGVVLSILSAMTTTHSTHSEAYRWASRVAAPLSDVEVRNDAMRMMERTVRRWKGEAVEGDYRGNIAWQIYQNIASALGIDLTDEKNPIVRGLRIAAKDDSPERVLQTCEHIVESRGAPGPVARAIEQLFNTGTAGSKVVHCSIHDFHVEGREMDVAYAEFKKTYCDSCPDRKPRPQGWRYTDEERQAIQTRHHNLVARLAGTRFGFRYTDQD